MRTLTNATWNDDKSKSAFASNLTPIIPKRYYEPDPRPLIFNRKCTGTSDYARCNPGPLCFFKDSIDVAENSILANGYIELSRKYATSMDQYNRRPIYQSIFMAKG